MKVESTTRKRIYLRLGVFEEDVITRLTKEAETREQNGSVTLDVAT